MPEKHPEQRTAASVARTTLRKRRREGGDVDEAAFMAGYITQSSW